jgi:hypothetical protein
MYISLGIPPLILRKDSDQVEMFSFAGPWFKQSAFYEVEWMCEEQKYLWWC